LNTQYFFTKGITKEGVTKQMQLNSENEEMQGRVRKHYIKKYFKL
jgi:hypothetical protein